MSGQFIGEVLRSTPVLFTGGFSGGVPRDLTANNWTVTTEDVPPFGARQFTAATSEYFNVASNSNLQTGATDFAFSMWVYPDTSTATMGLVSKYTGSTATSEYFVDLNTSRNVVVTMDAGSETTKTGSGVLTEDAWNHVVVEHDNGTGIRITINGGSTEAIAYTGGNSVETVDFRVGSRTGAATFLNGRLSRLGFWKKVLSSTELTQLYNDGVGLAYAALDSTLKTSLISYWNLDEASGNAIDSHTNGYDLTDNNSVTAALGTVPVLPSRTQGPQAPSDGLAYYSFNGSTQEWTVADHANLECGPHNYSMMAIFRASSAGSGTQQILAKSAASVPKNFQMQFLHSNNKVQATGSATTQTLSSTAISENQWYMMHLTNAGGTARRFTAANAERFNRTAINPGTNDFAVSGWVYFDTLARNSMLVSCGAGSNGDNGFNLFARSSGQVTMYFNDSVQGNRLSTTCNDVFAAGQWYHWVLNFDRDGNMDLLVNGTSKCTEDISGHSASLDPAKDLSFGAMHSSIEEIDGRMGRLLWHTKVLDSDDITLLNNDGKGKFYSDLTAAEKTSLGIYAAWDGTEASGNLIDSHGSLDMTDNNTVTTAGGPTGAVWYIDGVADTAGAISQGDESNAKDVHIGCREDDSGNATEFFQGDIGPVAMWNRTLTAAEVAAQYAAWAGLSRSRLHPIKRRGSRHIATGAI